MNIRLSVEKDKKVLSSGTYEINKAPIGKTHVQIFGVERGRQHPFVDILLSDITESEFMRPVYQFRYMRTDDE